MVLYWLTFWLIAHQPPVHGTWLATLVVAIIIQELVGLVRD